MSDDVWKNPVRPQTVALKSLISRRPGCIQLADDVSVMITRKGLAKRKKLASELMENTD